MRSRILGVAVLAVALAVTLFGVPLALAAHRISVDDEHSELEKLALRGAIAVTPDAPRLRDPVELPSTERSVHLAVYDRTGRRTAGVGPPQADPAVRAALRGSVSDHDTDRELVVAVPVAAGEGVAGAVRASSSRRVVQGRVVGAWAAMLGLASFAALCAVLLARVQARRVARPLEQLEEMAEQLGDGNFAVRAAPSGIAEIDGAGDSLNRTAERLGDLVARERAFSAQASHQLRTPLTGLRLGLDSALSSPDGDLRAAAAEAIVAADQLERTIDDLLALARGGAATGEALDVGAFLEDVRARWHGLLAAAGRPLRVAEEDAPPVCASVAAIRQILEVFMDNAYRHGKGTVTITARDSGGALAIDVADEGSAVLPRVPVTPPSPLASPDAEGSGRKPRRLGLTLARTLAEAEGGRILLSGSPSPTRATLLLPPTADDTGEDHDADPTGGDAGHEESAPSAR